LTTIFNIWMPPFEFRPLEKYIATHVGKILGGDVNNHTKMNLRFCVALDPDLGCVLAIRIVGARSKVTKVVMDFENYLIKCHFCNNLLHLLGTCLAF
jgi:hypothetical protein